MFKESISFALPSDVQILNPLEYNWMLISSTHCNLCLSISGSSLEGNEHRLAERVCPPCQLSNFLYMLKSRNSTRLKLDFFESFLL